MGNHAWRPLIAVLALVGIGLVVRAFVVPKDFGVHERGYMYGWHRKGNEEEWKKVVVKYRGAEYCKDCHGKNYDSIRKSPHRNITCENCHGPAGTPEGIVHYDPDKRPKLAIDKSRALCLRCHAALRYPTSDRKKIKGFPDPEQHNPGTECVMCHNPHDPKPGGAQ